MKELQEIKEQNVDVSKLASALQSEQLGASRAVSQNQLLKTQLDEMHDAFITLVCFNVAFSKLNNLRDFLRIAGKIAKNIVI